LGASQNRAKKKKKKNPTDGWQKRKSKKETYHPPGRFVNEKLRSGNFDLRANNVRKKYLKVMKLFKTKIPDFNFQKSIFQEKKIEARFFCFSA